MPTQSERWSVAVALLFVGTAAVLVALAPGPAAPVVPLLLIFAVALYLYWRSPADG
jgi:hypothetical protein